MLISFLVILLQAAVAPSLPADLSETEPRQDMGFGKSECSFKHLPATIYPYGAGHASWRSSFAEGAGIKTGTLEFTVMYQVDGPILGSYYSSGFTIEVEPEAGVPSTARLFIDDQPQRVKLSLRKSYPPGRFEVDLEESDGDGSDARERAASTGIVKSLVTARSAELRLLDRGGKQVAVAMWDVSKVRQFVGAIGKSGFTCRPGPNSGPR